MTCLKGEAEDFVEKPQGSPIRRIGEERWLRNIAVGLGNAAGSNTILDELKAKANHPSALVREHVEWAIAQQKGKLSLE